MHPTVVVRFKEFYADLSTADLARMADFYADDVHFADPIHRVKGLQALHTYMSALCENLSSCRFEYLDEVVLDGTAYIKWDMIFSHPGLRGGSPVTVRGISQLEFDERGIFFHEDVYDMGAMLYEHIAVIGAVIRLIRHRLARVS
jgi:hypothetical protein